MYIVKVYSLFLLKVKVLNKHLILTRSSFPDALITQITEATLNIEAISTTNSRSTLANINQIVSQARTSFDMTQTYQDIDLDVEENVVTESNEPEGGKRRRRRRVHFKTKRQTKNKTRRLTKNKNKKRKTKNKNKTRQTKNKKNRL